MSHLSFANVFKTMNNVYGEEEYNNTDDIQVMTTSPVHQF